MTVWAGLRVYRADHEKVCRIPERRKTMSVKSELLAVLTAQKGVCISGERLGEQLHCTRAAIWKAVKALREEGYAISSTTNRGYVLTESSNVLSADGIRARLFHSNVPVTVLEETASTNRLAKQMGIGENAPDGTVIVARCQTAGSGRRGRSFYSPAGSGIYFTVLLRPRKNVQDSLLLTTAAAVAALRGVEEVCRVSLSIKWMNDLYLEEKKVGGILTEAVTDFESGAIEFVVVGIGLNLYEPAGGFPGELSQKAGAILQPGAAVDQNALVASIVNALHEEAQREEISPLYRERNIVPGRRVTVIGNGQESDMLAKEILPDGRLVLLDEEGREKRLAFGDVSLTVRF